MTDRWNTRLRSAKLALCRLIAYALVASSFGCAADATTDPSTADVPAVESIDQALVATGAPIMGLAHKCIDISAPNDVTPNGDRWIVLKTCNGSSTQLWTKNWSSQLVNVGTGLCMNAQNASTGNNTVLIAYPCQATARTNEKWRISPTSADLHDQYIVGQGSGRCVVAPNSADGINLVLFDCANVSGRTWNVRIPAPVVGLAGKCLDVDTVNRSAFNNARVVTTSCNGSANQDWSFNAQDQLVNRGTGMCLNVERATFDNGTPIVAYRCSASAHPNEIWSNRPANTIVPNFQLVNSGSGKCLNVPREDRTDGTGLILWPCTGGVSNDTWSLLSTPKQTIKLVALALSDDDGSRGTTVTLDQFRSALQDVNGLFERAGVELVIDDAAFVPYKSTLLNTIGEPTTTPEQETAARNMSAFFNGGITVFLHRSYGANWASPYTSTTDYIVMKNTSFSAIEFAHELGHYFRPAHPFPPVDVDDLSQANQAVERWYRDHWSSIDAFNYDFMIDTPLDPGAWVYQARDRGKACRGSDQISIPLSTGGSLDFYPDRQNFLSYFNCAPDARSETISAQQIEAVQAAIGMGFRTQLVNN